MILFPSLCSETATEIPNNTNTTQKVTFPPEFSEAKTDGFETLAGSGSITTATINARTEIASTEGSNTQPTIGTQLKASTASVSNTEGQQYWFRTWGREQRGIRVKRKERNKNCSCVCNEDYRVFCLFLPRTPLYTIMDLTWHAILTTAVFMNST